MLIFIENWFKQSHKNISNDVRGLNQFLLELFPVILVILVIPCHHWKPIIPIIPIENQHKID
jgi:hypothetical protein